MHSLGAPHTEKAVIDHDLSRDLSLSFERLESSTSLCVFETLFIPQVGVCLWMTKEGRNAANKNDSSSRNINDDVIVRGRSAPRCACE